MTSALPAVYHAYPRALSEGTFSCPIGSMLIDLVIRALGPAMPDRAAAAHYGTFCTHETTYPFMIESFALRTDSGGPGQFRGGLGLERRYLMLAPCRISTRFERTVSPPWGINGGGEGQSGHVLIERTDGTTQVALKETLMLNAGDRERVRTDVMRGYVSTEAAREIYGLDTTTS